jgi:hypothetical protein
VSPDGATSLTVYGDNNVNSATAGQDLAEISTHIRVTYSNISGNIVTMSGYSNPNTIVYERDVVGSGSIDTLLWRYPTDQKALWQSANAKTALSFVAGDVSSAH